MTVGALLADDGLPTLASACREPLVARALGEHLGRNGDVRVTGCRLEGFAIGARRVRY